MLVKSGQGVVHQISTDTTDVRFVLFFIPALALLPDVGEMVMEWLKRLCTADNEMVAATARRAMKDESFQKGFIMKFLVFLQCQPSFGFTRFCFHRIKVNILFLFLELNWCLQGFQIVAQQVQFSPLL